MWLLANTGILGLVAFCLLLMGAFVDSWRGRKRGLRASASSAVWMLSTLVVLGTLSGPQFSQGFFWVPFVTAAGVGQCRPATGAERTE